MSDFLFFMMMFCTQNPDSCAIQGDHVQTTLYVCDQQAQETIQEYKYYLRDHGHELRIKYGKCGRT